MLRPTFALACLFAATPLVAATLTLKNGNVLTGEIQGRLVQRGAAAQGTVTPSPPEEGEPPRRPKTIRAVSLILVDGAEVAVIDASGLQLVPEARPVGLTVIETDRALPKDLAAVVVLVEDPKVRDAMPVLKSLDESRRRVFVRRLAVVEGMLADLPENRNQEMIFRLYRQFLGDLPDRSVAATDPLLGELRTAGGKARIVPKLRLVQSSGEVREVPVKKLARFRP